KMRVGEIVRLSPEARYPRAPPDARRPRRAVRGATASPRSSGGCASGALGVGWMRRAWLPVVASSALVLVAAPARALDKQGSGARMLVPSELDVITGITSTWNAGPGAIEVGTRVEHDRPADGGGYANVDPSLAQTYVDARVRYLYSLAQLMPELGHALHDGDV